MDCMLSKLAKMVCNTISIAANFLWCLLWVNSACNACYGFLEISKVHGERKAVYTVQLIPGEQLVLVVTGRQRQVRLVPYLAIEGNDFSTIHLLLHHMSVCLIHHVCLFPHHASAPSPYVCLSHPPSVCLSHPPYVCRSHPPYVCLIHHMSVGLIHRMSVCLIHCMSISFHISLVALSHHPFTFSSSILLPVSCIICLPYYIHDMYACSIMDSSIILYLRTDSLIVGHETDGVKVNDGKNCTLACVGLIRQGSSSCLCLAVKRTVQIYELTRTRLRHRYALSSTEIHYTVCDRLCHRCRISVFRKVKDIQVPGQIQFLALINERLLVGYPSVFALYTVQGSGAPLGLFRCHNCTYHHEKYCASLSMNTLSLPALVNNLDESLSFLMQAPVEAMCAVEISDREYLLVFASLGVYVDDRGRRSRTQEIMWPGVPTAVSKWQ